MTPNQRILLAILAFVSLTVGSFIWFVSSWDASERESLTGLPEPIDIEERLL